MRGRRVEGPKGRGEEPRHGASDLYGLYEPTMTAKSFTCPTLWYGGAAKESLQEVQLGLEPERLSPFVTKPPKAISMRCTCLTSWMFG